MPIKIFRPSRYSVQTCLPQLTIFHLRKIGECAIQRQSLPERMAETNSRCAYPRLEVSSKGTSKMPPVRCRNSNDDEACRSAFYCCHHFDSKAPSCMGLRQCSCGFNIYLHYLHHSQGKDQIRNKLNEVDTLELQRPSLPIPRLVSSDECVVELLPTARLTF